MWRIKRVIYSSFLIAFHEWTNIERGRVRKYEWQVKFRVMLRAPGYSGCVCVCVGVSFVADFSTDEWSLGWDINQPLTHWLTMCWACHGNYLHSSLSRKLIKFFPCSYVRGRSHNSCFPHHKFPGLLLHNHQQRRRRPPLMSIRMPAI